MNSKKPDSFEALFPLDEQRIWFDDPTQINERLYDRPDNGRPTIPSARFEALEKFPERQTLYAILRQYVQRSVPAYRRTEQTWWIVCCLPKTTHRRLAAVSLNWMETFVIFHDPHKEHIESAFVIVSESEFRRQYPDDLTFYEQYENTELSLSRYKAAKNDQLCISMRSVGAILPVLKDPVVLQAGRDLNLKLMRQGKTPYAKYHSFELADLLLD